MDIFYLYNLYIGFIIWKEQMYKCVKWMYEVYKYYLDNWYYFKCDFRTIYNSVFMRTRLC